MVLDGDGFYKKLYDKHCMRSVEQHRILDKYFGKKLEPLARKIFKDKTLKVSFVVYSKYDSPQSFLPAHTDKHACTYNMSYCLSQEKPWYLYIDGRPYFIDENELVAYSGIDSVHWRDPMGESSNSEVEMLFFHFVPEDHWFFEHCEDFKLDYEHVPQSN